MFIRAAHCLRTLSFGWPNFLRYVTAIVFASFAIAPDVYALNPQVTLSDYYLDIWTAKEGAPSDVTVFAQTPDGWLWLGGFDGLFRFDGVRFERYVPESGDRLLNAPIAMLRAEPNGDLWISYVSAGLSVLRNGRLTHVASNRSDSPLKSGAFNVAVDTDGSLWVATLFGLLHYSDGKWRDVGQESNLPPGQITRAVVDRLGQLWVASSHTIYRLERTSGKFEVAGNYGSTSSLIYSPDGRFWHTHGATLNLLSSSPQAAPRQKEVAVSSVGVFDRDGNFWATNCEGIAVCLWRGAGAKAGTKFMLQQSAADRPSPKSPLDGAVGLVLFEDREGNIWISTNAGIVRLRDQRIQKAPVPVDRVMRVHTGTDGHALVRLGSGDVWTLRRRNEAAIVARDVDVTSAFSFGKIFLATPDYIQDGYGANTHKIPLPPLGGSVKPTVNALMYDGVSVWASMGGRRLWRYRDGHWENASEALRLACNMRTSSPAGLGEIWLGCRDGSAARIMGDKVTTFGRAQGLDFESAEFVDARDGVLVGGSDGTSILSGNRFVRIRADDPRVLTNVVGLVKAPNGDRYLNGARGLLHIKAADWRALIADPTRLLRYTLIDPLDGYPGAPSSRSRGMIIDTAGILWFTGSDGVASLDTTAVFRKAAAVPVFVTALETAARRFRTRDGLILPPGSSGLRIDYTALGYTMPGRIRFRYRLDDVDKGWVDAGTRRAAYYTNLGPGDHRFSVIATNEDGIWNSVPVTVSFTIEPTLTQSKPFMAACAALLIGLMYMLHRLRLYRLEQRIVEHLRTRQLERERIARLLHDTFLQSVQGLTYAFQGLANSLPVQSAIRGQMEKLLDMAEGVIVEGRDNVNALRTPVARNLEHDLDALTRSLADAYPVQFSFTLAGTRQDLDPIVADELHLFAREAIYNACRHAQAEHLAVILEYDARFVRLCVKDDGRGIDPRVLAEGAQPGHWGLRGLRERADGMGAILDIASSAGKGTSVCLQVSADMAYQGQTKAKAA